MQQEVLNSAGEEDGQCLGDRPAGTWGGGGKAEAKASEPCGTWWGWRMRLREREAGDTAGGREGATWRGPDEPRGMRTGSYGPAVVKIPTTTREQKLIIRAAWFECTREASRDKTTLSLRETVRSPSHFRLAGFGEIRHATPRAGSTGEERATGSRLSGVANSFPLRSGEGTGHRGEGRRFGKRRGRSPERGCDRTRTGLGERSGGSGPKQRAGVKT